MTIIEDKHTLLCRAIQDYVDTAIDQVLHDASMADVAESYRAIQPAIQALMREVVEAVMCAHPLNLRDPHRRDQISEALFSVIQEIRALEEEAT